MEEALAAESRDESHDRNSHKNTPQPTRMPQTIAPSSVLLPLSPHTLLPHTSYLIAVFTSDFQDYVECRDRTYFRTRDHFSDYAEAKARDPSRSNK